MVRGEELAPLHHCSAVIHGSHVTLVGGNRSSWKNSPCKHKIIVTGGLETFVQTLSVVNEY